MAPPLPSPLRGSGLEGSGFAGGELVPLRDFLGERLYRHGGKLLPAEMIERVCGGPLDPGPLLAQLRAKFGAVYGLAEAPN